MKRLIVVLPILCILIPLNAQSVTYSTGNSFAHPGVSVALDDPLGSIYQVGEAVSFSVRADGDAYVLVYNIDTDGYVHLLYPRDVKSLRKIPAGGTLSIPADAGDGQLRVSGRRGMEFVFAIAVADRDFISDREIEFFLADERRGPRDGFRIDGDPFLGANRVARQLVRGAQYGNQVSMAYTYFFIGEAVDFPRYMCEDCADKGKDPYATGMPRYAATAAFDRSERLTYPLAPAFEETNGTSDATVELSYADDLDRPSGYGDDNWSDGSTTHVYVNYYPRWSYGYYYDPYYYDIFYWDPWYRPHGFYWSIGFNWGHHGYYHYPYYDAGYHHHHWYSPYYYGYGHGFHYRHYDVASRSTRLQGKIRHKSSLHTAMTRSTGVKTKVRRDVTSTTRAAHIKTKVTRRPSKVMVRTGAGTRSVKVRDARVIRSGKTSRDKRVYKRTRDGSRKQDTKTVRPRTRTGTKYDSRKPKVRTQKRSKADRRGIKSPSRPTGKSRSAVKPAPRTKPRAKASIKRGSSRTSGKARAKAPTSSRSGSKKRR